MSEGIKIYRAVLTNKKGFIGESPTLYFTDKRIADATLLAIMSVVQGGHEMEWECRIVSPMDSVGASEYIKEIIKNGIHMN